MNYRTALLSLAVWSAILSATNAIPAVTPAATIALCASGMAIAAIWIADDLNNKTKN